MFQIPWALVFLRWLACFIGAIALAASAVQSVAVRILICVISIQVWLRLSGWFRQAAGACQVHLTRPPPAPDPAGSYSFPPIFWVIELLSVIPVSLSPDPLSTSLALCTFVLSSVTQVWLMLLRRAFDNRAHHLPRHPPVPDPRLFHKRRTMLRRSFVGTLRLVGYPCLSSLLATLAQRVPLEWINIQGLILAFVLGVHWLALLCDCTWALLDSWSNQYATVDNWSWFPRRSVASPSHGHDDSSFQWWLLLWAALVQIGYCAVLAWFLDTLVCAPLHWFAWCTGIEASFLEQLVILGARRLGRSSRYIGSLPRRCWLYVRFDIWQVHDDINKMEAEVAALLATPSPPTWSPSDLPGFSAMADRVSGGSCPLPTVDFSPLLFSWAVRQSGVPWNWKHYPGVLVASSAACLLHMTRL